MKLMPLLFGLAVFGCKDPFKSMENDKPIFIDFSPEVPLEVPDAGPDTSFLELVRMLPEQR
jgi:hypothetical protein